MLKKHVYKAIGLMSGTSCDGLDIAYVLFKKTNDKWEFRVIKAKTVAYSKNLRSELENAHTLNSLQLLKLNNKFAGFCAMEVNRFLGNSPGKPDLVASHGHTVFHSPKNGYTLQIGNGAEIAALTGIDTICDFRSLDVALKGQGAPLVPIGDKYLFREFDACLNIGGIANSSFIQKRVKQALDICPANLLFNRFASEKGKLFDKNGSIGKRGRIIEGFSYEWKKVAKQHLKKRMSLSREYIEANYLPLFKKTLTTEDKLANAYNCCAESIADSINESNSSDVLVTGGGAKNKYLIQLIQSKCKAKIYLPNMELIDFKEAIIFAFLGVLRVRNEKNVFSAYTGSTDDHIGGAVYRGLKVKG